MTLLEKRGRVEIAVNYYDDESLKTLGLVSKSMVVVNAENNFVNSTVTYWGHSAQFDRLEPGEIVPLYEAVVENEEIKFIRKD